MSKQGIKDKTTSYGDEPLADIPIAESVNIQPLVFPAQASALDYPEVDVLMRLVCRNPGLKYNVEAGKYDASLLVHKKSRSIKEI